MYTRYLYTSRLASKGARASDGACKQIIDVCGFAFCDEQLYFVYLD